MSRVAPFVFALILAVAPQTAVAEEPAAIHTLLDLSFSECHNPRALAVGSTGWIYAAGLSVNVCGIAPWGQRALWTRDPRLATGGFPPLGASGLAFDPSGAYLYVANPGDSAILRIGMRPNGSPGDVEVFARGATDADPELLHGADGLAFDVTGQLWVAADQANEIQVLSPARALVARYAGADGDALDFPAGLAFFGRRLYVTSFAFTAPGTGKVSVLDAPYRGARVRR